MVIKKLLSGIDLALQALANYNSKQYAKYGSFRFKLNALQYSSQSPKIGFQSYFYKYSTFLDGIFKLSMQV